MIKPVTKEAYQLLHDGTIALAECEANGIKIDLTYMDKKIKKSEIKIEKMKRKLRKGPEWQEWRKRFGPKAKLGSTDQLGVVLFECLGHLNGNASMRKPSGMWAVEESYKVDTKFVKTYREFQKLNKNVGTFFAGIKKHTSPDGYLRPSFNLHLVKTYRSSSSSPNFQNFPVRDEESGNLIRSCFIPEDKDWHLVEIDYSGVEVRISACYHKDPRMMSYLADPSSDMHKDMAAQLYMTTTDQVGKVLRGNAKGGFVFPQFYGDYYFNNAKLLWELAQDAKMGPDGAGMPVLDHLASKGIKSLGTIVDHKPTPGSFAAHVQEVEKHFWTERFEKYGQWKIDWFAQYEKNGGFNSLTGFRTEGLLGKNDVINYPVQGSAFHCLLKSFIFLTKALRKQKMKAKLVGQIHDSIVATVHKDCLLDYLNLARTIMCETVPATWADWLITKLDVEADVAPAGEPWSKKKEFEF